MATTAAPSTPPLDYANRPTTGPRVGLYRVALFCALLPLTVGFSTLGLYAWLHWSALPHVGLATLAGGAILYIVAVVCARLFKADLHRYGPEVRRAWDGRLAMLALIMLANIPAAVLLRRGRCPVDEPVPRRRDERHQQDGGGHRC